MSALFSELALIEDDDFIRSQNCGEAVGDNKTRPPGE